MLLRLTKTLVPDMKNLLEWFTRAVQEAHKTTLVIDVYLDCFSEVEAKFLLLKHHILWTEDMKKLGLV